MCVVDATIWASDFLVLVLFCLTADIGWYFVLFSLRVSFFGRLPSLVTGSLTVGLDPDIFSLYPERCDSNVVLHLWGCKLYFAIAGCWFVPSGFASVHSVMARERFPNRRRKKFCLLKGSSSSPLIFCPSALIKWIGGCQSTFAGGSAFVWPMGL